MYRAASAGIWDNGHAKRRCCATLTSFAAPFPDVLWPDLIGREVPPGPGAVFLPNCRGTRKPTHERLAITMMSMKDAAEAITSHDNGTTDRQEPGRSRRSVPCPPAARQRPGRQCCGSAGQRGAVRHGTLVPFPLADKQAQSLQLGRSQKTGGVATRRQCIGIGVKACRGRHYRAFQSPSTSV